MGDVVNLRMARKRKARGEREAQAEQNRITHGVSRAERALTGNTRSLEAARLSGHRRDKPETSEP